MRATRKRRLSPIQRLLGLLVLVTWLLTVTAAAEAAPSPSSGTSAADQYVESVPTSRGPRSTDDDDSRKESSSGKRDSSGGGGAATGGGSDGGGPAAPGGAGDGSRSSPGDLPPSVSQELDRSDDPAAELLREVATSPRYGAPDGTISASARPEPVKPSIPTAVVEALGSDDEGQVLWLLIAFMAITVVAVGTAGYERRSARRPLR